MDSLRCRNRPVELLVVAVITAQPVGMNGVKELQT